MNYQRLYKNFQSFVDHDDVHMTEGEQQDALIAFKKPFNKKIFQLSIILIIWSVIGLIIDTLVIGGSVAVAVVSGPAWIQFLPTIIFSVVNWAAKSFFVYAYMKKEISSWVAFLSGFQYIGFTLLLRHALKSDPHFRHGLSHYIQHIKKKKYTFVANIFKNKNTS